MRKQILLGLFFVSLAGYGAAPSSKGGNTGPGLADNEEPDKAHIIGSRIKDYFIAYEFKAPAPQVKVENGVITTDDKDYKNAFLKAQTAAQEDGGHDWKDFTNFIKRDPKYADMTDEQLLETPYDFDEARDIVVNKLRIQQPTGPASTSKYPKLEKFVENLHIRATNADVTSVEDPTVSLKPPTTSTSGSASSGTGSDAASGKASTAATGKEGSKKGETKTNAKATAAATPAPASPEQAAGDSSGSVSTSQDAKGSTNPATISYTRDYNKHSDQLALKGALIYTYKLTNSSTTLVPSVEFNRLTGASNAANDVNSLVFRVGGITTGYWPKDKSVYSELRFYGTYGTDFNFRSSIPAAEAEWEPTNLDWWGNGIYSPFPYGAPLDKSWFKFRWRGYLHSEYGYVSAAGGKEQLSQGKDFFRVGPALELSMVPTQLPQLNFTMSYNYYAGTTGEPRDTRDFKAVANWQITNLDNTLNKLTLSLQASYEDGMTSIVNDKVNALILGFGVKY